MLQALALAGLSAGGSLLSSIGAGQASAKQGRLQQIADGEARRLNDEKLSVINVRREELGRMLLDVVEENKTTQTNFTQKGGGTKTSARTWGDVDVDAMMAAADKAGFNPATFLNAGALQYYARSWQEGQTSTDEWQYDTQENTVVRRGHNAADAYKMMLPEYALSGPSQVPQQSSMLSALGGALSAGTNAFGTQLRADQSYDLQLARMLGGNAAQGMGLSDGNGFAQVIRPGSSPIINMPRGGGVAASVPAVDAPAGETPFYSMSWPTAGLWKQANPEVTNNGMINRIDPTQANAQNREDRGGEGSGVIYGLSNEVHDLVTALTGATPGEWGIRAGMSAKPYREITDTTPWPSIQRWWNSPTSFPNTFGRNPATQTNAQGYFPFPGSSPLN